MKKLNLSDNKISDINVLEKAKFEKLEILELNNNIISDIDVFKRINIEKMIKLDLSSNKIDEYKYDSLIQYLESKIQNVCVNLGKYVNKKLSTYKKK